MKQKVTLIYLLLSLLIASIVPVVSAQDALACSTGSGERVSTFFVNDLGFGVTSHWIDFECNEEEDGTFLEPNVPFSAGTGDGHEFIFRDAETGEYLGYYKASVADIDQEVLISNYVGQYPDWWNQSSTSILTEQVITLVPIDESLKPSGSCSSNGGIVVRPVFWNNTGTDLEIHFNFVNLACQEEEIYVFPDNYNYTFTTTFVGDDYTFRNSNGELLGVVKITADMDGQEIPLTDIITVIKTDVPVDVDAATYISDQANPRRQAAGLDPLIVNSGLQNAAEEMVNKFPGLDSFVPIDVRGNVNILDLAEGGFGTDIASSWDIQGNLSILGIYAKGLQSADIVAVLNETIMNYEGWTTSEITSFATYQSGDLFVLITSDAVEEEWETFEYEGEASSSNVLDNTVTEIFVREDGVPTYEFDSVAGQYYALWYQSEVYDTYLYLNNPAGEQIAADDDGAGDLNSLIIFKPEVSGTHTAILDSYQEGATGEYRFSIAQPDNRISAAVAANTPYVMPFDVVEGVKYVVWAESEAVDTTLLVRNHNGVEIRSNDDAMGTTNSFVWFTAETTGTYEIVADSYNSTQAGPIAIYTGSFK